MLHPDFKDMLSEFIDSTVEFMFDWDGMTIPIIGLADLIKNKRSTGRTKDLADAEQLEANFDN